MPRERRRRSETATPFPLAVVIIRSSSPRPRFKQLPSSRPDDDGGGVEGGSAGGTTTAVAAHTAAAAAAATEFYLTQDPGRAFDYSNEDKFETLDDNELAALDVDDIVGRKPMIDAFGGGDYGGGRAPLRTIYDGGRQGRQYKFGMGGDFDGHAPSYVDHGGGGGHAHGKQHRNSYPTDHRGGGGASFGNGRDGDRYPRGGGGSTFGGSYDDNFGSGHAFDVNYPRNDNDYGRGAFAAGDDVRDGLGRGNYDGSSNGNADVAPPLCPGHDRPCRVPTGGPARQAMEDKRAIPRDPAKKRPLGPRVAVEPPME
jgi:hypothetical protein